MSEMVTMSTKHKKSIDGPSQEMSWKPQGESTTTCCCCGRRRSTRKVVPTMKENCSSGIIEIRPNRFIRILHLNAKTDSISAGTQEDSPNKVAEFDSPAGSRARLISQKRKQLAQQRELMKENDQRVRRASSTLQSNPDITHHPNSVGDQLFSTPIIPQRDLQSESGDNNAHSESNSPTRRLVEPDSKDSNKNGIDNKAFDAQESSEIKNANVPHTSSQEIPDTGQSYTSDKGNSDRGDTDQNANHSNRNSSSDVISDTTPKKNQTDFSPGTNGIGSSERSATSTSVNIDLKDDTTKTEQSPSKVDTSLANTSEISGFADIEGPLKIRRRKSLVVNSDSDAVIFFIHGVGGSSEVWNSQLEYFAAQGYEIISADLIGHGFSAAPTDRSAYLFEEISRDLLAIFDNYRRSQNVVIGHSYG